MSYLILRNNWCDVIVLNVCVPTEDKYDDQKDSFHDELQYAFDQFPNYHMIIFVGDFNIEGWEDTSKLTIKN
jgi:hypothetical protein